MVIKQFQRTKYAFLQISILVEKCNLVEKRNLVQIRNLVETDERDKCGKIHFQNYNI